MKAHSASTSRESQLSTTVTAVKVAIAEATSSRSHQVESWEERAVSGQMVLSKMTDNSSSGSDYSDSSSLFRDPEANHPEVAEKSELHKSPSHRPKVQTRATPEERKVQSAATHRAGCPCVPALQKFIYTSHRGKCDKYYRDSHTYPP